MSEEVFSDKLSALLASEAARARRNPGRYASMIEQISRGLGFTVAMAAGGDGAKIDELLTGAEAYAHAEAVEKAEIALLMATLSAPSPS